jgi:hypothetical protein
MAATRMPEMSDDERLVLDYAMTMPTISERGLQERAKRLGYKLRRCGTSYRLISDDGTEGGSRSIESLIRLLDAIESRRPHDTLARAIDRAR